MKKLDFPAAFKGLTGYDPFLWQGRLFEEFVRGDLPTACDIPTGLGKTSVIPIWIIALARQQLDGARSKPLPRRLVYVVDRRTVVDQATDVAEKMRSRLRDGNTPAVAEGLGQISARSEKLLAISTLRGEFADNREWQEDPARAAIIIGTVDMIGSRLLFSGYGVSRKMRPFHAGLLGQDALIIHDEAHLSPAFGKLIKDLERLQKGGLRPFRTMDLSATQRGDETGNIFGLKPDEETDQQVMQRMKARKSLTIRSSQASGDSVGELVGRALEHEAAQSRVVVYVRTPDLAKKVAALLPKDRTAILTGTIRGHERDLMASPRVPVDEITGEVARRRAEVFRGFRADPDRKPPERTEYLVATSAGEVGIDLDANHMVSDLTTLDSMIQRLGRVNRLGRGSAVIDVVQLPRPKKKKKKGGEDSTDDEMERLAATKAALESLEPVEGGRDASPRALRKLMKELGAEGLRACFSREPRMVELTDILLDGWSMTALEDLPGRPSVERWLHGITPAAPSVYVAWREEVNAVVKADEVKAALKTLFDKHPIRARERLRGPLTDDVIGELGKIAKRLGERRIALLPARGDPKVGRLVDFLKNQNRNRLREATIVLPSDAGGLDRQGMLDGSERPPDLDVADLHPGQGLSSDHAKALGHPERRRILLTQDDDSKEWTARQLGRADEPELDFAEGEPTTVNRAVSAVRRRLRAFAETGRIVLRRDDESGQPMRLLLLLSARKSIETVQENPAAAAGSQSLQDHLAQVRDEAERIAARVGPIAAVRAEQLADAVVIAAAEHDRGKDRDPWQADIGNPRPSQVGGEWKPLAKSGRRGFVSHLSGRYRHEFGSLRQAAADSSIENHPERDLILHLVAAHHGWARPHFEADHWDIAADVGFRENEIVSASAIRRFALLQRRFGRWGLAWLEALMRAADYQVSTGISADESKADSGGAS